LTELAQQAGLPNSTTHRLLTTMQQQGFVRQVGELGHWAIGAHAFMVGSSFLQSRNLLAIVHPILRNLMEESGETVNMAVLDQSDHEAIIIDQVQCTHLMRMSAPIGGKLPMHASGAGKAFLAQLSEEQVTKLLHRKGLHAYTHATLVSPVHLKEDLAQTRKRGYSFDDEEHALGLRCLAACIFDEHREPFAAISISGPISRITDDRVTEFGAMVIKAAKEVTLAYGGMR
ncbi:glyoxylate bypass operon transcriptional repressor IclR, partial [Escherichia coli]